MRHTPISDEDLVRLFSYDQRKARFKSTIWLIVRNIFIFSIILLSTYTIANFNALKVKFIYWYDNDLAVSTSSDQTDQSVSLTNSANEPKKPDLPVLSPNTIKISSIGVEAPIIWEVNNVPEEVAKNLENGVIHLHGTALPGQKGNIYITGHSSNYSWGRGQYNNIFALLDKLIAGDIIYLNYHDITYSYIVAITKVVPATDTSVLDKTDNSELTLVTCWPVGTSLKRLVVIANQTYPDPNTNIEATTNLDASKLPSGR